ncbi:MAG: DUF192 domain-containing protein [Gammaproteobacteria bacterium]|nr:DUF192 domain-containing protein [Gammaproteobacteria bacterium]
MMAISKKLPVLGALVGLLFYWALAMGETAAQCQTDNAALQAMDNASVQFRYADGKEFEIKVKLADNPVTRAAGFQQVCAATIAEKPILFLFEREVIPNFHMNNVFAPIDIAFIDQAGRIDSIHAMQTYVLGSNRRPLYSSRKPVVAALEVHPGFYRTHNIDQSVSVSWQSAAD